MECRQKNRVTLQGIRYLEARGSAGLTSAVPHISTLLSRSIEKHAWRTRWSNESLAPRCQASYVRMAEATRRVWTAEYPRTYMRYQLSLRPTCVTRAYHSRSSKLLVRAYTRPAQIVDIKRLSIYEKWQAAKHSPPGARSMVYIVCIPQFYMLSVAVYVNVICNGHFFEAAITCVLTESATACAEQALTVTAVTQHGLLAENEEAVDKYYWSSSSWSPSVRSFCSEIHTPMLNVLESWL